MSAIRAYVLSIGSELLDGHLTDTNATYLAQELRALGAELVHVVQVRDDRERIASTISHALEQADLVICTGGVGPTEDDLTREAIADVAGETPEIFPALEQNVRSFFEARGSTMPARNAKQAWLIPSAESLPNPIGTAPGWLVTLGDSLIVAMPGVPREMHRMWPEQALPRIRDRMTDQVYRSVTIKTIGVGESALEDSIQDLVARPNPNVATFAKDDGVHVRITGMGSKAAEAELYRSAALEEIESRLAAHIFGYDDDELPVVLANLMTERRFQVAVRDQGGGGRFASMMLSHPVSERLLVGAVALPGPGENAAGHATIAAGEHSGIVGIGIAVDERPSESAGIVTVSLQGALRAEESFPMRSPLQELQRRSVMFTSDLLHRQLRQM